jgi:hypothetical protein
MASNTCTVLNAIVQEYVDKHYMHYMHYIEYSKKMIPEKFEELATCKMFAHFKNPHNTKEYKSVEEYDLEIEELANQINKHNYDAILDTMKTSYDDYVFEYNTSRGAQSIMFSFMQDEYQKFIFNYLEVEIFDDDNYTEEYSEYESDVAHEI